MERLYEGFQAGSRYSLIKSLRSGGNADVWQALDRLSGTAVALKFSRSGSAAELSAEFENLRAVSHPAIVTAHDLTISDGHAFLVLELIDGNELSQYMGADYRVWLPMLRNIVDALAHAHSLGVVHGDIKLENILVDDEGRVRLVDFAGRPGHSSFDDIRALAVIMSELATGLRVPDSLPAGIPAALGRLIGDIRDGSADSIRMDEVAGRIDAVLNEDMKPGETEQFERIEPVARQVDATRAPETTADSRGSPWSWLAGGSIAVMLIVLVSLLWPRLVPDSTPSTPLSDTAPTTAQSSETKPTDRVSEAQARFESLAQQTRSKSSAVYQKWLDLEAMNVSTWAELRARRAFELLQEGERLASDLDYVAALRELTGSDEIFNALLEQAPGIAADRRESGWLAYRGGDAETAAKHFRVALAIEPHDDDVRAALQRTVYLEQIVTLTRQARQLEDDGDLNGALAALGEALRIDSDNTEIELEVGRLESKLESDKFQATMSAALSEMQKSRYQAARNILRKAAALRPGAPEVRDATTQIELAERAARTASLRASALDAEKAEDWETAIELYSQLLAIDSALVLAQRGRDRSRRLAGLTARAETLLDAALTKDETRRQAEDLVEQIANVKASAPQLQSLSLKLEDALRLSRLPVVVRLESDNLTEIQVQRVVRLGVFERHELKLMPGQYTVVGTRVGYRDVRAELIVQAGIPPEPLIIRCEEQI